MNEAPHSQPGMEVTYHKAPSGLGRQARRRGRAADNRTQHPSRHQVAGRPAGRHGGLVP